MEFIENVKRNRRNKKFMRNQKRYMRDREREELHRMMMDGFKKLDVSDPETLRDIHEMSLKEDEAARKVESLKFEKRKGVVDTLIKATTVAMWGVFTGLTLSKEKSGYIGEEHTHRELSRFLDVFRRKDPKEDGKPADK